MKNKLIIGILFILNLILLFKVFTAKYSVSDNFNTVSINNDIQEDIKIDTLILKGWKNTNSQFDIVNNSRIICFFSKQSCQSCLEKVVHYFRPYNKDKIKVIFASVDIEDENDIKPLLLLFGNNMEFYKVEKIHFSKFNFQPILPMVTILDKDNNVLFFKSILPLEEIKDDNKFVGLINLIFCNWIKYISNVLFKIYKKIKLKGIRVIVSD